LSFLRSMGRRSRCALKGGRWYPRQAEASKPTATGPVRDGTRWDERRFGETKNRVNKPGNET
jgi:hypothetical protein